MFFHNVKVPYRGPEDDKLKILKYTQNISLFQDVLFDIFRALVWYPTIMEKQKKSRESTDLAEYIFLGTNNFSQLQIVKKLELCQDMERK